MAPVELLEHGARGLTMLYGSQTGTAEEVAWDLVREGRRKGFACDDPMALNEMSLTGLSHLCSPDRVVLIVVSTTGQGDLPVNMRHFWQDLTVAALPPALLEGLRFTVFGLGDSHYVQFNYAARKLYARLQGLGAKPFCRCGLGDDQHDFGYEQELDPWAEGMWEALASLLPATPTDTGEASAELAPERRYDVQVLEQDSDTKEEAGREARCRNGCRPPRVADDFYAEVVDNTCLCSTEHTKNEQDVRNVRLSMPSGRSFEAGDVCTVWPQAEPGIVRRFVVETLDLDPRTRVRVIPTGCARVGGGTAGISAAASRSIFPDTPLTLEEVFSAYLDIQAVPSRHFFYVLSFYTDDTLHRDKLREFASRSLEAKDSLYEYCKRERRSAAEVMWDFYTCKPPLADLISSLPAMRPRQYSIASCPRWYASYDVEAFAAFWNTYLRSCSFAWRPRLKGKAVLSACAHVLETWRHNSGADGGGCFELCVGVVSYVTKTNRMGMGLCSSYLQRAEVASRVLCSIEKGTLGLPPLEVPLILICPGTGLSPCRALVQERHLEIIAREAACSGRFARGLKDLMFLGFRHQKGDFLYKDDWSVFGQWLSVHVAFSRDHEDKKVYVQDLIEEQGAHVCSLLDAGARIYICGRAHPMPSQVFDILVEVLETHRGVSTEDARRQLQAMQRDQRYVCDTWA